MMLRFQFNTLPRLQEGKTVLLFLPWVWVMLSSSKPSYRVFASVPPLFEARVYFTDRRILVLMSVFRLVFQEVSLWFSEFGKAGEGVMQSSAVGENGIRGHCLDVMSKNDGTQWYRSPELRVRMFTRHAHQAHAIISQMLGSKEYVDKEVGY
jgi:hypothetical protein